MEQEHASRNNFQVLALAKDAPVRVGLSAGFQSNQATFVVAEIDQARQASVSVTACASREFWPILAGLVAGGKLARTELGRQGDNFAIALLTGVIYDIRGLVRSCAVLAIVLLLLKGQGNVLAMLAAYVQGKAFLFPSSVGAVNRKQGYGFGVARFAAAHVASAHVHQNWKGATR